MRLLQDESSGSLPGMICSPYQKASRWTSTVGNCQMAIIWFRLANIDGDSSWKESAKKATTFSRMLQARDIDSSSKGRQGALRGSFPGFLGYGRYWYMNWTQKFYLDALLAQMGVEIC